jgi:integrase
MHAFARAGGSHEPMLRTFADTGMRLGEVLALRREDFDGQVFQVRRTAHNGRAHKEPRPTMESPELAGSCHARRSWPT